MAFRSSKIFSKDFKEFPDQLQTGSFLFRSHGLAVLFAVLILAAVVAFGEAAGLLHFKQYYTSQLANTVALKSEDEPPETLDNLSKCLNSDTAKMVDWLEWNGFSWDEDTDSFINDAYEDSDFGDEATCSVQFSAYPGLNDNSVIQTRAQLEKNTVIYGVLLKVHSDRSTIQNYDAASIIPFSTKYGFKEIASTSDDETAPEWLRGVNVNRRVSVKSCNDGLSYLLSETHTETKYALACGSFEQTGFEYVWVCASYPDDEGTGSTTVVSIMSARNFQTYCGVSIDDSLAAQAAAATLLFGTHIPVDYGLTE